MDGVFLLLFSFFFSSLSFRTITVYKSAGVQEAERESEGYWIKSGIVTVIKDSVFPDGKII